MKKIDTKNIIAVIYGDDRSALRFITKDGENAYILLAEPLEDGTRFVAPEYHRGTDGRLHAETPSDAWYEYYDIYGNSEKEWEAEANNELAHCGLKLGDYHRLPVAIEGDIYDDGWYELQNI